MPAFLTPAEKNGCLFHFSFAHLEKGAWIGTPTALYTGRTMTSTGSCESCASSHQFISYYEVLIVVSVMRLAASYRRHCVGGFYMLLNVEGFFYFSCGDHSRRYGSFPSPYPHLTYCNNIIESSIVY